MATNLNFDNLVIDRSGRASFSGLSSGIDLQKAVDGLIAARRIPIDRIEQRISDNQVKIAAFQDVGALALHLKSALDKLRGVPSFDRSSDMFEAKRAFATARRADAGTPSQAAEIVGVTVTNRSQAASHTIEVQQIAAAHKIASDGIIGALETALGQSGTFRDQRSHHRRRQLRQPARSARRHQRGECRRGRHRGHREHRVDLRVRARPDPERG